MRFPAALLSLLLLTACSSGGEEARDRPTPSSPQPTPSMSASARALSSPPAGDTPSPAPSYAVRVVPVKAGEFAYEAFLTPSRNISCAVGQEEDGHGWARCDIAERSWTLPPPDSDCELDWGAVATVTTTAKRGHMGECVSDAAGGEKPMAYGHALRLGRVECRSSTSGVECVALDTKHGFFVSKATYRTF